MNKPLIEQENPCHICGSQSYVWGKVRSARFVSESDDGLVDVMFGHLTSPCTFKARKCRSCKNIQLFDHE